MYSLDGSLGASGLDDSNTEMFVEYCGWVWMIEYEQKFDVSLQVIEPEDMGNEWKEERGRMSDEWAKIPQHPHVENSANLDFRQDDQETRCSNRNNLR